MCYITAGSKATRASFRRKETEDASCSAHFAHACPYV